jgi:hypothetical protein
VFNPVLGCFTVFFRALNGPKADRLSIGWSINKWLHIIVRGFQERASSIQVCAIALGNKFWSALLAGFAENGVVQMIS